MCVKVAEGNWGGVWWLVEGGSHEFFCHLPG